jgi:hypothetical protein
MSVARVALPALLWRRKNAGKGTCATVGEFVDIVGDFC